MPAASPLPWPLRTAPLVVLLTVVLAAGACDAGAAPTSGASASLTAMTPSTTGSVPPGSMPPASTSSRAPEAVPSAVPLAGLAQGAIAVTVDDSIRVRSQPRVADDSERYAPLLPRGTSMVVTAGPITASGYTWYRVAPIGVKLDGGVDQGWVAAADHDGTPWVALAADPTPGFELATGGSLRVGGDLAAARSGANAMNAFGLALYRRLITDPSLALAGKDIVFSPMSIATALSMARAGAAGRTASQMDAVLRVAGWDELAGDVSALMGRLGSRDATWREDDVERQLALRIANLAFAQRGYTLEPAYLDRIGRTLGSGLGLVDYVADSDGARDAINGWVSRQTLGRIPQLLAPPNVTAATRLVLVNAVYLKAAWTLPFAAEATTPHAFTLSDGTRTSVPTMELYGDQDVVLASGDGWRATELSYLGADGSHPLSMTLIVPADLATFEASATPQTLGAVERAIAAQRARLATVTPAAAGQDCDTYAYNVHLFLPRFKADFRGDLVPSLRSLGMKDAVTAGVADFSGITTADQLVIGAVIHQANIDVDEKGTEAAAATAIGMDTTGGCPQPIARTTKTLRVDHPFLFLLRDVETGAILFMGRVLDPRGA